VSSPPPGPQDSRKPRTYNSAPSYGQPLRKSRAGLIVTVIVILVLVALGALGTLAYRLTTDHKAAPDAVPSSSAPSFS